MAPVNPWNASNLQQADPTQRATWPWAVANAAVTVQQRCDTVNDAKAQDYAVQWTGYAAQRDAHPTATNIVAPVPARKQVVIYDASGWPEMGDDPGGALVCPVNVYTPPVTGGSLMLQPIAVAPTLDPPAGYPVMTPVKRSNGEQWVRLS